MATGCIPQSLARRRCVFTCAARCGPTSAFPSARPPAAITFERRETGSHLRNRRPPELHAPGPDRRKVTQHPENQPQLGIKQERAQTFTG